MTAQPAPVSIDEVDRARVFLRQFNRAELQAPITRWLVCDELIRTARKLAGRADELGHAPELRTLDLVELWPDILASAKGPPLVGAVAEAYAATMEAATACGKCGRDSCPGPNECGAEVVVPFTPAAPRARVAESLSAFMARVRTLPAPAWLVKDLIPDEGIVVWHGRPRSMKSLTAEDTMLSLAMGEPCALGNPRFAITAPVGVLWLGEEDPERLDAFRFGLMLNARGVAPGQEPEAFRLVVRPGWNLEAPHGQAELLATIHDTAAAMAAPLRVLVIDPARASLPSLDGGPKDAAAARAFLLAVLRDTPVKVILLPHHDTKPRTDSKDDRSRAERASGGVTFSMADCMVSFERLTERETMAVPSSYKGSADPQPFRVRFESETPAGAGFRGFIRARAESTEEDTAVRDAVLEFVRKQPWSSTAEVDRGAKVRTGESARYLAQLQAAGLVESLTGEHAKARGRSPNAVLWGAR
jgi:hypothetical protein